MFLVDEYLFILSGMKLDDFFRRIVGLRIVRVILEFNKFNMYDK